MTTRNRISRLTGEFPDSTLEARFREHVWPEWSRQVRIATLLGVFFFFLACITDYLAVGASAKLAWMAASRTLVVGGGLAVAWASRQENRVALLDRCLFLTVLLVTASYLLVMALNPQPVMLYTASVLVVVLAVYLFLPTRTVFMVTNGVALSAGFIAATGLFLQPTPLEWGLVGILLLACNTLGIYTWIRAQILARRDFLNREAIERHARFDELTARLSTSFITEPTDQIDATISRALAAVGQFADADRSYIFDFDPEAGTHSCTHEWCREGITPQIQRLQAISNAGCGWSMGMLLRGEVVHVASAADLPPEAGNDLAEMELQGVRSMLMVPMVFEGRVLGCLGFDSVRHEKSWSRQAIALLRIAGGIVISALQRRHAELAVQAREQQFETLARMAPVGIFRDDAEGRCIYVNQRAAEMSGLDAAQILDHGWVAALHPEDRDATVAAWHEAVAARAGFDREIRWVKPDGKVTWTLVQATPEIGPDGACRGFVGTVVDVTEQRAAAEVLQARTRQLENSNLEMARSNAELQRFAYIASHDLLEPLRGISSFAGLLAQKYAGRLDEDADEYIRHLTDSATRMHHLITDLLNYSRVDSQVRPFVACNLNEIVDVTLSNLGDSLQSLDGEVSRGSMPIVQADPLQMLQVFQNLVGNALKYHGKDRPRVTIDSRLEDDHWLISVRDNGIGVPPEHAERIFDLLKRLHPMNEYPGSGVGLAICRRIVERHGGRIWMESNKPTGSAFFFTLPAQVARQPARAA